MGNCCGSCIVKCVAGFVLYTGKGLWLLTKLGFTAVGVAAGSLAAGAMAATGNVKAGGVIARATSRGMRRTMRM